MSIVRKRLTSEESRDAAIEAARQLLLDEGPQAVTLKAVAAKIGRTHANLLHHFGSAAQLQSQLARSIAERVTSSIASAVERARKGETDAREIVDGTFDAFGKEGAGALAAWMILTGNRDALDPVLHSIRSLVAQLSDGDEDHQVGEATLWLVLLGLGDALLGQPIADALRLDQDTARQVAADRLRAQLAQHTQSGLHSRTGG
ncbi:TetR/AcrR family transcriptional regulator [Sphingomonas sinipercae]|uniref:TetR/AcrR family transcriptional regulator n=1 Tax=Sphingomonas sinipercae TaxID=2714944 RepID=A0A6G7ZKL9_9SPHN|nr:helix-turn-helix domain-containing protein [Sphingomonas sinipercae]QIL01469.1 TetR/AcrR family transcriptional regulator [Sphingomonas sinipercae]